MVYNDKIKTSLPKYLDIPKTPERKCPAAWAIRQAKVEHAETEFGLKYLAPFMAYVYQAEVLNTKHRRTCA